jgi:Transposase
MAAVMIGVDPHKGSHTAVVISAAEQPLGELCVRASAGQAGKLVAWAAAWPERTWAVEGAAGLGHLLAQQLVAAGEQVLDVQPKLAARVRLLQAGDTNKNDPSDALSVAVAALRSPAPRLVRAEDCSAVLKVWAKRHRDLARARNQVACRLHAVLCDLVPGRSPQGDLRSSGGQDPGEGHAIRCGCPGPGRARRRVPDRPAPPGCPAAPDQEEARRRGPGLGHQSHRRLRRRPGDRRHHRRRLRRRIPVPQPRPLRRLQRHRPGRGVLRQPEDPPPLAARQPAHQPRHPHGRDHPDQPPAQRRPRVLRQEADRGQDAQRSCPVPQAPDQRRSLRPTPGRRPPGLRQPARHGPGRATGERLCLQRGRLTPRTPALRTSHSRTQHQPTTQRHGPCAVTVQADFEENSTSRLTTTAKRTRSGRMCCRFDVGRPARRSGCSGHRDDEGYLTTLNRRSVRSPDCLTLTGSKSRSRLSDCLRRDGAISWARPESRRHATSAGSPEKPIAPWLAVRTSTLM